MEELARRFRLEDVGHSAGVFDVEKLAWANRHYLKASSPQRLVELSVPYLQQAGWVSNPSAEDIEFLSHIVPAAAASVDRIEQVPARLSFVFDYAADRALEDEAIRSEARGSRAVIDALAEDLKTSPPLLDRDTFRAAASRVKDRTGQKGKALFHPIRLALTGAAEGLELDIAVPAIERGGLLRSTGITRIMSARERAGEFARSLASREA
jgi:nondiscriminating glutamyl-tRNA synthetase